MKAVRFELVKPSKPKEANASEVTSNERAAGRVRGVFDLIVLTATGTGLPDELDKLLVQIRSFSEDIASAEDWVTPESITMRTWFRALSKIPAESATGSSDVLITRYRDILDIVLKPDTSKFKHQTVAIAAAKLLPPRKQEVPSPMSMTRGRGRGALPSRFRNL